ncbi:SYF2 splicing factor family protein [Talaromyces stipitatus ATCC 10500]|uniref:Pre-mRNA-splicing factor SYF2 n=1 Tax=Talaromyces stipitatus (strain ATCC 10500 / CBS 375.48 / QM 6759 / NRRL 1006) TaxID=441959 RepID=B8MLA3_TALSN|nr:SYF2 splicing factor family protein [Talaromyces stipitatus ATCC 10500]EED15018.1 SYF2 splicing factor family protein [Talaromyces stipitatus ATCC 10500]
MSSSKADPVNATENVKEGEKDSKPSTSSEELENKASNSNSGASNTTRERLERFKALKARAKSATDSNLKETIAESQRLATDPALLSNLSRKHAFASHNLLKADTEEAGEDFERKRAWDWTVEESERWDRRMEKKQRHRDDVAFQDYRQDARKVYKRQLREMQPNLDAYEKEKIAAVERAAASGGLEIVETNDGELVAVDRNGTFYSTADSTDFTENKPDRAAVDRLVADLRKAEEVRLKKRRDRRGEEDPDVTYINEKNKQFNQKLARFYDKVRALLFYSSCLF